MKVVVKFAPRRGSVDGGIDHGQFPRLCRDVASLAPHGHQPIVVSSGAVAAGVGGGPSERPTDVEHFKRFQLSGRAG